MVQDRKPLGLLTLPSFKAKSEASKSNNRWMTPSFLVALRNIVRDGDAGIMIEFFVESGPCDSAKEIPTSARALRCTFDFAAGIVDALVPSENDISLYATRAAQPERESSLSKESAIGLDAAMRQIQIDITSLSPVLTVEWLMQSIADAVGNLDPSLLRKCPVCTNRLFYARRRDQKACSLKHARLLRSRRWLGTVKGQKHYATLLKSPKRSKLLDSRKKRRVKA